MDHNVNRANLRTRTKRGAGQSSFLSARREVICRCCPWFRRRDCKSIVRSGCVRRSTVPTSGVLRSATGRRGGGETPRIASASRQPSSLRSRLNRAGSYAGRQPLRWKLTGRQSARRPAPLMRATRRNHTTCSPSAHAQIALAVVGTAGHHQDVGALPGRCPSELRELDVVADGDGHLSDVRVEHSQALVR